VGKGAQGLIISDGEPCEAPAPLPAASRQLLRDTASRTSFSFRDLHELITNPRAAFHWREGSSTMACKTSSSGRSRVRNERDLD